jgi:transcriptional regulator with XRE-family HTH domain
MQDTLARRLRVLRAERGLTLRDAERLTGVDKDTLSKIERGVRHPQDVTLARIAKGYEVLVEELIEEPVPLGEAPEAGPTTERGDLPRSSPAAPEGGSAGGEARRALYLTRDLEEVRGLANLAQRELETVITTFFDEIPDLPPLETVKRANGWAWRIGSLRSHVFVETGRWETQVLGPLSGEDLPDWERELLAQIRAELDKADAGLSKLSLEFSQRWEEAYEQARRASSQQSLTVEQLLEGVAERTH